MLLSHLLLNYVLVEVLGMGVWGLGIAALSSRWVIFTTLYSSAKLLSRVELGDNKLMTPRTVTILVAAGICIYLAGTSPVFWRGSWRQVLQGWGPMLLLGLSGAFNEFTEMGIGEVATLLSQFISATTLSVMLIQVNLLLRKVIFQC